MHSSQNQPLPRLHPPDPSTHAIPSHKMVSGIIHRMPTQPRVDNSEDTPSSSSEVRAVITGMEAHDVIANFKRHLQEKWRKNKAKQHVNKIIHYHVQHTFFLRNAAPLFLGDYQDLLSNNLAKESTNSSGSNQGSSSTSSSSSSSSNNNSTTTNTSGVSGGREQGLIATLKQINIDVLNGKQKTKSIDVLESYLRKLEQKDQLNEFLEVLIYIIFGENPPQIPAELNERKKNLFHYVSPIIAFLIIFYIHAEKKPLTLDELVTRSGLKQLYKNVCKEVGGGGNQDDQSTMHEDQRNQNNSNNMNDSDSEQQSGRGGRRGGNDDDMDDEDEDADADDDDNDDDDHHVAFKKEGKPKQQSSQEEDSQVGDAVIVNTTSQSQQARNTQSFLDLEKTISQQKHQLVKGLSNRAAPLLDRA